MMGYKMPFTASEDEQPQQVGPASADEEACPVSDRDGISSFILQLTCISSLPATKDDSPVVWNYNRHNTETAIHTGTRSWNESKPANFRCHLFF